MLLGEQRGVDEILASLEARYSSEGEQTETDQSTAFDYLPSRGIWIALATFVPTFLTVVIGVPHVLTSALAPHTTEPRVPVASRSATTAWARADGVVSRLAARVPGHIEPERNGREGSSDDPRGRRAYATTEPRDHRACGFAEAHDHQAEGPQARSGRGQRLGSGSRLFGQPNGGPARGHDAQPGISCGRAS